MGEWKMVVGCIWGKGPEGDLPLLLLLVPPSLALLLVLHLPPHICPPSLSLAPLFDHHCWHWHCSCSCSCCCCCCHCTYTCPPSHSPPHLIAIAGAAIAAVVVVAVAAATTRLPPTLPLTGPLIHVHLPCAHPLSCLCLFCLWYKYL